MSVEREVADAVRKHLAEHDPGHPVELPLHIASPRLLAVVALRDEANAHEGRADELEADEAEAKEEGFHSEEHHYSRKRADFLYKLADALEVV